MDIWNLAQKTLTLSPGAPAGPGGPIGPVIPRMPSLPGEPSVPLEPWSPWDEIIVSIFFFFLSLHYSVQLLGLLCISTDFSFL